MIERLRYLAMSALCVAAVLLVQTTGGQKNEIIWFIVAFILLSHGYLLMRAVFGKPFRFSQFALGIVLFLAIQSIAQTAWYYSARPLGPTSDAVSLLAGIIVTQILFWIKPTEQNENEAVEKVAEKMTMRQRLAGLLCICVAGSGFGFVLRAAHNAATVESIRTPWPLLQNGVLVAIALIWTAVILSAAVVKSSRLAALLSAIAIAATTTITPLLYRIGYGFDGFLHIASEKIILRIGTLQPMPFYYIGQYVFTTWLTRLTDISITTIDHWLVPISASILLPLCIYISLLPKKTNVAKIYSSEGEDCSSEASSAAEANKFSLRSFPFLILPLLPLTGFIATTPQGFSYVLGLCALILCLGVRERTINPIAPIILVGWAAATHPLAGIPIGLVVIASIAATRGRSIFFRFIAGIFVLLSAISIPAIFYIMSLKGGTPISWNLNSILNPEPWLLRLQAFSPWIGNRFVLWPAWASLVDKLVPLILLALAIIGIKKNRSSLVFIGSSLCLWIAATALKSTGDFTFLIDYERGNYADRLNTIAILCLIPAAIPGLTIFIERLKRAPRLYSLVMLAFVVAIGTALSYNALPRHDALVTGRGWSTGAADQEAVKLIEYDADGKPYTVLANQSVSAAAVDLLGFKRYSTTNDGDVFFYPIPTGGPLYETFLRMTYGEPSRDTAKDAAKLGGTDLVYVVLNSYWWKAPQVAESLRAVADKDWSVPPQTEEGWKLRVFKFDLKNASSTSAASSTR